MRELLRRSRSLVRPMYWRARFTVLNSPWLRRRSLARKLGARLPGERCTICGAEGVSEIRFFHEHPIVKRFCPACEHVFSRNLNRDPEKAADLFDYGRPNDQYDGQRRLQLELVRRCRRASGSFLDFGVGGNLGIADELRRRLPSHEFLAADLYASERPGYFQLYSAGAPMHRFDGISSNAVIEHLDNTLEAWGYLNRLLKPMAEGGGLMAHAFPSQLVEDPDHWAIQIASHECLFSLESLALTCRRTGFERLGWRFFSSVQHPVHFFRKVRDLE